MVKLLSRAAWCFFSIQVPNPIAGGLEVVDPPPLSEDMMGWWMDGGERINGRIEKKHPPQPEKYRQRAKKRQRVQVDEERFVART